MLMSYHNLMFTLILDFQSILICPKDVIQFMKTRSPALHTCALLAYDNSFALSLSSFLLFRLSKALFGWLSSVHTNPFHLLLFLSLVEITIAASSFFFLNAQASSSYRIQFLALHSSVLFRYYWVTTTCFLSFCLVTPVLSLLNVPFHLLLSRLFLPRLLSQRLNSSYVSSCRINFSLYVLVCYHPIPVCYFCSTFALLFTLYRYECVYLLFSRKHERQASENSFTLIRVDNPSTNGCKGTSIVVGPYCTTMAPSMQPCVFPVFIDKRGSEIGE